MARSWMDVQGPGQAATLARRFRAPNHNYAHVRNVTHPMTSSGATTMPFPRRATADPAISMNPGLKPCHSGGWYKSRTNTPLPESWQN